MEPDAPTTIEDSIVLAPGSIPANLPSDANAQYRSDLVTFGWWSIAKWSILAAGIYPLLLSAVGLIVHGVKCLVFGFSSSRFTAAEWFWILLYIPLVSVGCLLWVGMIAAVTLPVIHLVIRSLELRLGFMRLGAFTGGFLVFIATLPISLDWPQMHRNAGWWEVARVLLMGPALATIVGQIGGAYGGLRAARRAEYLHKVRQALVQCGWRQPISNDLAPETDQLSTSDNRPWLRFRTTHLLWVVVWISVLLAAIRLVGLLFETVLPVICGWLLYQSLTLWLGSVAVRRLAPWWASRWQGRST